jgi:hypothetical protein
LCLLIHHQLGNPLCVPPDRELKKPFRSEDWIGVCLHLGTEGT